MEDMELAKDGNNYTSDEETKTWKFFDEVAAFDGSVERIDDRVNRCSRKELKRIYRTSYSIIRWSFYDFEERFSKEQMVDIVKALTLLEKKAAKWGSVQPAILILRHMGD